MKRKSERLKSQINIEVMGATTGTVVHGVVHDLSEGGLFMTLRNPLPAKDEMVTFVIQGVGDEPVIIGHGAVRWSRDSAKSPGEPGCGIEYRHLSKKGLQQLQRMIAALKTSQVGLS